MKILPIALASATAQVIGFDSTAARIVTRNWWIGNDESPNCGCQVIIDPYKKSEWNYMNGTCRISFPYARDWGYGQETTDKNGNKRRAYDPHFVYISSSFAVGRDYKLFTHRPGWSTGEPSYHSDFVFTGYDTVSNANVLDIMVFYHETDCLKHDDSSERGNLMTEFPYMPDGNTFPTIPDWKFDTLEYRNLTGNQINGLEGEFAGLCDVELICEGQRPSGVRLSTFEYNVKSSGRQQYQSYDAALYGLKNGATQNVLLKDYQNRDYFCGETYAHAGHGSSTGCTAVGETAECSNVLSFTQNTAHSGNLEYFVFNGVDPVNHPQCMSVPDNDSVQWQTPSQWDTQNYLNEELNQSGPKPPIF